MNWERCQILTSCSLVLYQNKKEMRLMKKRFSIFMGVLLGIAFFTSVVFAVRQYHIEEEEETKKELKARVPEALTPYQIGDKVQVGDFLWQVSEAELINDYESLDDYYKLRGYLKVPKPNQQNPFAEEQKFLRVKFSVQNTDREKDAQFSFLNLKYANYRGGGLFEKWELYYTPWYNRGSGMNEFGGYSGMAYPEEERFFDGKCKIRDSLKPADYFENYSNITLAPGEVMDAECIVQFYEYGNACEFNMADEYKYEYWDTKLYIYDLCIRTFGPDMDREQYISLNIAPKHLDITKTDIGETYEEQRDIAGMKARQMTNLEMKQYQDSGYPLQTEEEALEDMPEEEIAGENYLQESYNLAVQIQKSEVVEWKDMPETFRSQGYLQKMAERYKNEYGYSDKQLKVLLLDISYTGKGMEPNYLSIYDYTWLFTRGGDKKRWVFGTADDWTVLSNGVHPERTGHINTEWIGAEQTMVVQAAYILPPDIWEKEDAMYFCSGIEWKGFCKAIAEVKLK